MNNWEELLHKYISEGIGVRTATARVIKECKPDVGYEQIRANGRRFKKKEGLISNATDKVQEYDNGVLTHKKLISIRNTDIITPTLILEKHGMDKWLWEVVSYKNNYWNSLVKDGEQIEQFQSCLKAKPIADGISLDEVSKHFDTFEPKWKPVESRDKHGHKMVEINLADLHFGRLCWHGNTGGNYDHKIATQIVKKAILDICEQIKHISDIDYILFIWTNDFFNSDTPDRKTTGFTQQETDIRWEKMYNAGCEILIEAIEQLRTIAEVRTLYTRSNHDAQMSYCALMHLYAWYHGCDNVKVDKDAYPRKYIEYGTTLLGLGHGEKERKETLWGLMPIEAREEWGRTKYHEFHVAHLHSEQETIEKNGMIIRRISSPTIGDTWTVDSGFVGTVRKIQTFVYDKDKGQTTIINTIIDE